MNKTNEQISKLSHTFKNYYFNLFINKDNPNKIEKQLDYLRQHYNPQADFFLNNEKFNINEDIMLEIFNNLANNIDKIEPEIVDKNFYLIKDLTKNMLFKRKTPPQVIKLLTIEPRLFKSAVVLDKDAYYSKQNDIFDKQNIHFIKKDHSKEQIADFLKDLLSLQNKKYNNSENQDWALNIFRYFYTTLIDLSHNNPYTSEQNKIKILEFELPPLSPIAKKIKEHIDYMDNYSSKTNKTWGALTQFNEHIFKFDENYSNSSSYIKSYISLIHHCYITLEENKNHSDMNQEKYEKSMLNLIEYQKTAIAHSISNNINNEYINNRPKIENIQSYNRPLLISKKDTEKKKYSLFNFKINYYSQKSNIATETKDTVIPNQTIVIKRKQKEQEKSIEGICYFMEHCPLKLSFNSDSECPHNISLLEYRKSLNLEEQFSSISIYNKIEVMEPYKTLKQKYDIQKKTSSTTLLKNKKRQML